MRRTRPYVSLAFSLVLASCGSFTPIGEGDGEGGGGGDAATGGASGGSSGTSGKGGGAGTASGTGGSANAGSGGSAGSANAGSGGTSGGAACEVAMDCPPTGFPCSECVDGSLACPVTECANGQCSTSFPTCVEPACEEDSDCPVSLAPCSLCADGSSACPWARCDNGVCASGIETCDGADPCAGKACGDACELCDGEDCVNRPAVLAFCNSELECQFNEPVCEGKECSAPEDCPQTDVCSLCPDGETCASRTCVNGACQFQCVPDACADCAAPNVCVYQVGGPGPSHYACAEQALCESPWPCSCIVGQGTCQPEMVNGFCQCDNGLD